MFRYEGSACSLILIAVMSGCAADEPGQQAAPPPPEVMISQVVSREVTNFAEFTGRTDSAERVEVRARVSGYLEGAYFDEGLEVERNERLFQIDPRPFQFALDNAEGQKAQWEARLVRARADVERYKKLVPTGAATQQDLDKAQADVGEAVAAVQSAQATIDRAQLDLEFATIKAQIGGQISRALITKGNLIRADVDLLTTIVSLDPIYVYFDVDERTLLRFRQQARSSLPPNATQPNVSTLQIPVHIGLANEEGYPHEGVIDFADNRVDPATGTIRVRGTFDNAKRMFKPGLFARVRIPIGQPTPALLVVDRAIGTDQSNKFVYVVDEKNTVQYRAVQLGWREDDGLRVVTAGLQPGDWVIVTGIQRARPGAPVTPQRVDMPVAGIRDAPRPATSESGTDSASPGGRH